MSVFGAGNRLGKAFTLATRESPTMGIHNLVTNAIGIDPATGPSIGGYETDGPVPDEWRPG